MLVSKLLMKMTSIGIREWGIVNLCMPAVSFWEEFSVMMVRFKNDVESSKVRLVWCWWGWGVLKYLSAYIMCLIRKEV